MFFTFTPFKTIAQMTLLYEGDYDMTTMNLIAARSLRNEGLCVTHTTCDGEKRPFGKWREFDELSRFCD